MSDIQKPLSSAGNLDIESLKLVSSTGMIVDLDDYLIEFNLFEDIFSPTLHGTILISDSRNLVTIMPIIGEELLLVKMTTPSLGISIEKAFKIYGVTDKTLITDTNTQVYTLHFCSQEAIIDNLAPIAKSFEGKITDIVENLFLTYFNLPKTYIIGQDSLQESKETTPLYILNDTANKVKFISPGWSAIKCINWLASKAIPKEGAACNFLFWESTKSFYFGSIEHLLKIHREQNLFAGHYKYHVSNIKPVNEKIIGPDLNREFFLVKDVTIVNQTNTIKSFQTGYLSSGLTTVDLNKKRVDFTVYDHAAEFPKYEHTERENAIPIFSKYSVSNPYTFHQVRSKNTGLFSDFRENYDQVQSVVWGNRNSNLNELDNLKLHITVPGRTDMEVGMVIRFSYPDTNPKSEVDKSKTGEDELYSGYYLITAIRHKVTLNEHVMVMEIVKDSFSLPKNDTQ